MRLFPRVRLRLLVCAIIFGPIIIGIFPIFPSVFIALAVLLVLFVWSLVSKSSRPKQASLLLASICLTVTLIDLGLHPLLFCLFEARPTALFTYRWPLLPELYRFATNVRFCGSTYGDLAAVSRDADWQETKHTHFVTDEFGFRNDPAQTVSNKPLNLIVLGDSFGVASGSQQHENLSGIFSARYGLRVYNLSVDGANPWQEYVNLMLAGSRLNFDQETIVLWMIFSGNDLDEPYYDYFNESQLPWRHERERAAHYLRQFRYRSPLRQVLFSDGPTGPDLVIERKFIDGRRMLFFAPLARIKDRSREEVERHPNLAMLRATIAAMKKMAHDRRFKVVVVLIPTKEEVYSWVVDGKQPWTTDQTPSGFSVSLHEMCAQREMAFLDLKPTLVSASKRVFEESGQLLWWSDDTHWNPMAQQIVSAIVHAELLRPVAAARPAL